MMDYETFRDVVKEKFLSFMPEQYQDMELRITPVAKVNRKPDGLSLWRADAGKTVFPTLYVNDMYRNYLKTGDLEATLWDTAKAMDGAFRQAPDFPGMDISAARDSIIFQLVNTLQNEEMLRDMPHREFQDLSIIYRWVLNMDGEGISSAMVSNSLAGELGMDEGQLFLAATENTRRLLPPVVRSMGEVLADILANDVPPEPAGMVAGEAPPEPPIWVISNERGTDGAASMLYEDKLHGLAESLGSDLYILPSSIHEVLALPVGTWDPEELAHMVAEINAGQVEPGDRLSNQVYHYDRSLRTITPATDTPDKRPDGDAKGQGHIHETKQSR